MAAFYGKKRPLITDSEFENTVFLLKTTEVQDNNVFLDSSSNNVAITRVGNVSPGTFSPFSRDPGYWSNYFDGSGDYLSLNTDYTIAGNFTAEAWIYNLGTGDPCILGTLDVGNQQILRILNGFQYFYNGSSLYTATGNVAILANTWVHLAVTKENNTIRLFTNGVLSGTTNSINSVAYKIIGGLSPSIDLFKGYISNLRVIDGVAIYTNNFTPPNQPLTAIANTSLLTCQNHRFKDNSANNFTITRNGDARVSTFSPFSTTKKYDLATTGSSIYINGAASPCGLRLTNNASLNLELNDFTVEMWIYTQAAQTAFFIASHEGGQSSGFYFYLTTTQFILGGYLATIGTFSVTAQPVYGSWNHIAWSRTSGTLRFFLNGVELGSTNASTWNYTGYPYNLSIGADQNGDETRFTGYMSNIRIVNGSSIYTGGNFTPPTAPVTAIANTVFLLDFNNQGVYDATGQNQIDTVNALSSNSITLFNKNTVYFDGNGDYLTAPNNPLFAFDTDDFTIEAWIYTTVNSGIQGIIGNGNGSVANPYLYLNGLTPTLFLNNITIATGPAITLNTWYHIAVTRTGTTFRVYTNGVAGTLVSYSVTLLSSGLWIGSSSTPSQYFNGYISELRITRGVDRYRPAFTVPSQNLESVTNTSLLVGQNNTFVDSSDNRFALTANGDARVTAGSPFAVDDGNYSVYFDGTGDYLTVPSSTNLAMETNDFTFEFWMYLSSNATSSQLLGQQAANFTIQFNTTANELIVYDGTNRIIGNISVGIWTHFALVRNGTTLQGFINGIASGSSWNNSGSTFTLSSGVIGARWGGTNGFNGYISNLRVIKGTALYTANFTPSTSPLTAITNTSLLTCQSPTFKDSSTNNFAITPAGNVTTRKHSPFLASGSVYFDGTGDRLATGYSSLLDITQGDFTIDVWIYPEQANGQIMVQRPSSGTAGWNFRLHTDSTIQFWYTGGTTFTTAAITLNRWTHIACVRNGTAYTTYINGVSAASGTIANGVSVANTVNFYIGTNELVSGNFKGFMSNLRIVKGSSVYTGNFTPSTAPLTAITNTVLLTCQGDTITDYSNNHVLSTFENTSVVGFSPNDLGSFYFDGTGDYLTVANNTAFQFDALDFTIECWIFPVAVGQPNSSYIYTKAPWGSYSPFIILQAANTYNITLYSSSNGTSWNVISNAILGTATANSWNHIAVVRYNGNVYGFLNGILGSTSVVSSTVLLANASNVSIGSANNYANSFFAGYISNFRVVKGTALYTTNFTPPALEFPIRGTTS